MSVVVGVDPEVTPERALVRGRELADAHDGDLHVVHVLGQSEVSGVEEPGGADAGRPGERDRLRETAAETAASVAADVLEEYEAVGRVGNPAEELVRHAREVDAEYLVVGGRRRSPAGKALFGSVTQSVLLNAERPVVAITTD